MARIARIVIPGQPHHIVQRGNRRQSVFFYEQDREKYLELLLEESKNAGIEFLAYCLMDNHVHLIAVPEKEYSLACGIGEAHRKYTRFINFREGWRGYLWQGRFSSYPLNEAHLYAAIRYVERNPVRAGLVKRAEDYRWSSAPAHVFKRDEKILSSNYLIEEIKDWAEFLSQKDDEDDLRVLRKLSNTGRPMGDECFVARIEEITGRLIKKRKPGPKSRGNW